MEQEKTNSQIINLTPQVKKPSITVANKDYSRRIMSRRGFHDPVTSPVKMAFLESLRSYRTGSRSEQLRNGSR